MNKKKSKWALLVIISIFIGTVFGKLSGISLAQGFPLTITDSLERDVVISRQPETIISLAPSNTEILFALGLGDRVIAVSEYCNYPPEAQNRTKIGGFSTVNIEKVVDLEPDLVLATCGVQEAIVEELEGLGLTVIALDAKNTEDVIKNIRLVGKATGQLEIAEELARKMEQRIKAVTDKTRDLPDNQKPKVFYETWNDPLMTVGLGTFIHHLIHLAGGVNIALDSKTEYPVYNLELLIERNPEVIIISLGHGNSTTSVEEVKRREGWQIIDAVKNNRVYGINADIIARTGPRIVDALEEIAGYIHPELKKNKF
jgi:iron complex transport system substrate-binding protein